MQKKSCRGFSLLEMLISVTLTVVVMGAVVAIVISTQRTSLTESMKQEMNQGSRALQQVLGDDFKSAGAMLSIINVPSLLGIAPVFNGIYPFNNNNYADGVILAAGDPDGVSQTTDNFDLNDTALSITTTQKLVNGVLTNAWGPNDFGMVIRAGGYYVFRCDSESPVTDSTHLLVNDAPAYFSGLIQAAGTTHYVDACTDGSASYASGSWVVRLDYFHIFLVRGETDGSQTLTLTTDTQGDPDFLRNPGLAVPIIRNIEDIQFSYVLKDGTVVNPANNADFLEKRMSAVRVFVLYKTERQKYKGLGPKGIVFRKPVMGDRPATTLPVGLFNYIYNEYEIYLRDYNVLY
jgi:type II secretory pathway pseudopilin PulG